MAKRAKTALSDRIRRRGRLGIGLIGAALLVGVLVMPIVQFGVGPRDAVVGTERWEAAPCTIDRIAITSATITQLGMLPVEAHWIDVEFSYEYRGRRVSRQFSHDASLGTRIESREHLERAVAALEPGTQTTCYINPRDPGDAILTRGEPPPAVAPALAIAIVGALVCGVCFGVAARARKRTHRRRNWGLAGLVTAALTYALVFVLFVLPSVIMPSTTKGMVGGVTFLLAAATLASVALIAIRRGRVR